MCLSGEDSSCREYRILGAQLHGGYAELVRCPVANVVPIPDGIPFEEAAAFPLVFLTAWRMLMTRARVVLGEDVLVWAAGSGVGMAAIQIAKVFGARVIATAGSAAKLEQARALGADATIDHHAQDVVAEVRRLTAKKGVEVVIEHTGEQTWERSILSLAHRGRLVTCGATTGPEGRTELRHVFAKQLTLMGSYMGSKADLLDAAALFFQGRLRPVVHEVMPLADAPRAHEMMEASRHFGKIVLKTG
jgi:NADPH:quinone reductase-like Zn-dependent oxidoreductase